MYKNWYQNERWLNAPKHVMAAATVVVNDQNELLLIRSPRRGWEIPGGQVEQGESISAAAVREAREESGIQIKISAYCGVFQNTRKSVCSHLFRGEPLGGILAISSESLEVGWFPLPDALDKVTFLNFRERIEKALEPASWPFLVEFE